MSAGRIEINFEGLCPFFTKHLAEKRLMVGVQSVFSANLVRHTPMLTIMEEDVLEPVVYHTKFGRNGLVGDASFLLYSAEGEVAADLSAAESLALLDVENDLYPTEDLKIDTGKCQLRLHFKHGVLSPIRETSVGFFDLKKNALLTEFTPQKYTYSAKLDLEIPEGGNAVLHFSGEADDFIFKSGRNYIIKIESLPADDHSHHNNQEGEEGEEVEKPEINHFQYFYLLADNVPNKEIVPRLVISNPVGGNPFCMLGEFGNTEY